MDLFKAKVLITGGGRGIGNFIAMDLLDKVEKVIVIDNDTHLLSEIEDHERLVKLHCDITDPEMVLKVISEIFSNYNGINVCINNEIGRASCRERV